MIRQSLLLALVIRDFSLFSFVIRAGYPPMYAPVRFLGYFLVLQEALFLTGGFVEQDNRMV